MKFVTFLAFVAAIGMCYTAVVLAQKNVIYLSASVILTILIGSLYVYYYCARELLTDEQDEA